MKIFLIEDDDYKQQDICYWLNNNYPDLEVSVADSFRGARSILKDQKFDVCILDMNLPSFGRSNWSGAPDSSALAGRRLINFMEKTGVVKRVIVFTQYSTFSEYTEEISYADLVKVLREECPRVFFGAVHFLVGDVGWKMELDNMFKKIINEDPLD